MTAPAEERESTMRIATAVMAFAESHPQTRVIPVYLPADVYATAQRADASPLPSSGWAKGPPPWEDRRLADQLLTALADLDPIDLSPALSSADHFLQGDYHLSPQGHRAVAALIQTRIDSVPTPKADAKPAPETPDQ